MGSDLFLGAVWGLAPIEWFLRVCLEDYLLHLEVPLQKAIDQYGGLWEQHVCVLAAWKLAF